MSKTKIYQTWVNIRRRSYEVSVCKRWESSFENFLSDMGPLPTPEHTIDRIDSTGDYEPDNCRWATWTEQANNKSNNRIVSYNNEKYTLANLCRKLSLDRSKIYNDVGHGNSFEAAINIQIQGVEV